MRKCLLFIICSLFFLPGRAQQKPQRLDSKKKIICYAQDINQGTRIYPKEKKLQNAKTQSTNIEVVYHGFTTEAQNAFQTAVDIWAGIIDSPVTIHIDATWQSLDAGVLGSAIWGTAYRGFEGAKEIDTWYPVALAEKMAGKDLNDPSEPDIVANFSSAANWYLGTDGNPGASQYDLVSVVLHEIGHGLGFVDSFGYDDSGNTDLGYFGLSDPPYPFIFDRSVRNGTMKFLTEDFDNPSEGLATELVSNNIFFDSPTAKIVTGSTPRLYAPSTWSDGSSIAHLDENTYPSGNENSLMTPQIGKNEVMQDPGPIMLNMFGDMGWEYTYINHDRLPNTEDFEAVSYNVTATINSDIDYEPSSVTLYYSLDGFASDTTEITMSTTGNPDEFSADILSENLEGQTYSYYISVLDSNDRIFKKPSLAPQFFYTFTTEVDIDAPVIEHTKPAFVKDTDTSLLLEAKVKDFLPLANVDVEYYINDQAPQTIPFVLVDEFDSLYQATIDLSGVTLSEGDSVRYRILATDESTNANSTTFPETGLIKLDVFALSPSVAKYSNDFNNETTAAEDFFASDNFQIKTASGFNNGAIHSDHPYANGTGSGDSSSYTLEMKVPIILNDAEAFMTFDEVVLVEPGTSGTQFGDDEFWDYVIVEGSNDGGVTWQPLLDGYDSRANSDWLSVYNSDIDDDQFSHGEGDNSMFVARKIDILKNTNFEGGDEVIFRFRLLADQAAHGWGWAIDNLNIQVDQTPPVIKHNFINYITDNNDIKLEAVITDNFAVDSVAFVDENNELLAFFPPNALNTYNLNLGLSAIQLGDTIRYRIEAYDNAEPANVSYLPGEDSFFEIPFIAFNDPVSSYSNNFNASNSDFVGNFFKTETVANFSSGAIQSSHPYLPGFALEDEPSTYTYTLTTPITVDEIQHYMAFDHVFLGAINSDIASVEASKDGGATWITLDSYTSSGNTDWRSAVNNGLDGSESLFSYKIVNLTGTGDLKAGDEILIRFKLSSQVETSSWGWAIDNLEIQTDNITALPETITGLDIQLFPNPVDLQNLTVRINAPEAISQGMISVINSNAQVVRQVQLNKISGEHESRIAMDTLPPGLYLIKINLDGHSLAKKIVKL